MKLVHKIGGGFLGLVLIIAFLGAFSWYTVSRLNTGIEFISSNNLPDLIKVESFAYKVEHIQAEQVRYVSEPTDELAESIIKSADNIIAYARDSLDKFSSAADVQGGIVDLYKNAENSMVLFKEKFDALKVSLDDELNTKTEMMNTSETLASRLNGFYKIKDMDQGTILSTLDLIGEIKAMVADYTTRGAQIRNSKNQDVLAYIKVLDKTKNEILEKSNKVLARLDQGQKIKGLILKRFINSFYDSVVGLTKGSGKELTDPLKIRKAEKKYNQALKELNVVLKQLEETPKERLRDNSAVVAKLKEESTLVTEVRLANLNYIITKNSLHKNFATIKLKRAISKLDDLSALLETQGDKMTVVDLMNILYGYQDIVNKWQSIANKINTEYVPEATAMLSETSGSFSQIVSLVEESTSGKMQAMVKNGVSQSSLGIIISAVSAFVGLLLTVFITIGVRKGIMQVLNIQSTLVHEGDLNIKINDKFLKKNDEIGQLFRVAQSVLEDYQKINDIAQRLASGHWHTEVIIKSEKDEMNQNLSIMIEQVNMALHQVANTVERVVHGSEQVREASRSLSEGATSQAASLEEITSSMSQLGSQTNLNAENAEQASVLSKDANQIASDGKDKMNHLALAMEEISKSAADTQKVVKTIDDIAFQTNLLALNAAVEAARAGVHGKGFAVVAEEVRNLAARSAKAAGETAELIDSVVKEINKGNSVARVTADVLDSVASGISKTTDLVSEIASASSEQAQGVRQINIGLEQIDAVTMQNTANAEETASATEEMKNQASELQELVGRFELKDISDEYYDYEDEDYDEDEDDAQEIEGLETEVSAKSQLGWGGADDYVESESEDSAAATSEDEVAGEDEIKLD